MNPKVLVTGSTGLVGTLVTGALAHRYDFSGLSRRPTPGMPSTSASVEDLAAIRPAFTGVDMVLHLAGYTEDDDDWESNLSITAGGTANVFRAAQEAGVRRVVFASSGSTTLGWERDSTRPYGRLVRGERGLGDWPLVDYRMLPRPDSAYACAKLFGEACARHFADRYGMSAIVIRFGAVKVSDRPEKMRDYPGFLAQADAVAIIDLCLAAPESLRFDIFDAISENSVRWRDTSHAKEVLGWTPTGSSDGFTLPDAPSS